MATTTIRERIIAELANAVGDPIKEGKRVKRRIAKLHNQAVRQGDGNTAQFLAVTYESVDRILAQVSKSIDMTAIAREQSGALMDRLEIEAREHSHLKSAMMRQDESNPLVEELINDVRERFEDEIVECDGFVSYDIRTDITFTAGVPISVQDADLFHAVLVGTEDRVPHQMLDELGEFITDYCKRVKEAQREMGF